MGLFDLLFGRKKTHEPKLQDSNLEVSFSESIMTVRELGFIGLYSMSPNKEWVVSTSDQTATNQGIRGGNRSEGKGTFILYNRYKKSIVLVGHVERPNNPHVADNGTFTLENWLFGDELGGIFYTIDASGRELIRRDLSANLIGSGISKNGAFAVAQTANSKTDDGGRMIGFDIQSRTELFAVRSELGFANEFVFDEDSETFGVKDKTLGTFYYSKNGVFLDAVKLSKSRLNSKVPHILNSEVKRLIKDNRLEDEESKNLISVLKNCLNANPEVDYKQKAESHKLIGLLYEKTGMDSEALSAFQVAIKLNPKAGVQRKITSLSKKVC